MKRRILLFVCLAFLSQAYAQNSLRYVIRGDNGITRHFVTLTAAQQVPFSPQQAKTILSLDAASDLILSKSENDDLGNTIYRFSQTYKGIPIEGSMYIVQTKAGKAIGLSGELVTEFPAELQSRSSSANIAVKQAIDAAVNFAGAKEYMWQNPNLEQRIKDQTGNAKASYYPTAKLVWYNSNPEDESLNPKHLTLAFKVDVYAHQPLSRAYYFVDAQTGKVLGKNDILNTSDATGTMNTYWSGSQTLHSDLFNGSYRLRDLTKGNGVITLHGESGQRGNDYTSASANWNLTGADQAAMDAHFGVSSTYSFYSKVFHRNSYDGLGTALYSYVNDPTYIDNAFWDGSAMNFNKRSTGEAGGVTGIDVCGHELTHGVTQTTCALVYSKESGAMNESLSDIMGKNVQFYTKPTDINWQLSNDMNWIIRDMSNPKLMHQPNTYKGQYWVYSIFIDNGGVHTNSGIGNYMYYLLCNGGSGTNDNGDSYTVTKIGFKKAASIIYRTQTVYLFPNALYSDWRTACINAATDLYGASSNAVAQVKNAFFAIGIGTAALTEIADAKAAPFLKVSPNPVTGSSTVVSYQLVKDGNATLKITDLNSGRPMQNIVLGNQKAGTYNYTLTKASSLPVGNYVLTIEQNGTLVSRTRFFVAK